MLWDMPPLPRHQLEHAASLGLVLTLSKEGHAAEASQLFASVEVALDQAASSPGIRVALGFVSEVLRGQRDAEDARMLLDELMWEALRDGQEPSPKRPTYRSR